MKRRVVLPVALAALFMVGTAPMASAKKMPKHMVAKGTGQTAKVGLKKQSATGGPAGGSTKGSTTGN